MEYNINVRTVVETTAYAKAEKGNLSKAEQNAMAKIAKSLFADYGRRHEQIV
jgi:hypothetical protein